MKYKHAHTETDRALDKEYTKRDGRDMERNKRDDKENERERERERERMKHRERGRGGRGGGSKSAKDSEGMRERGKRAGRGEV